jgi:uncharacterized protein (TIGR03437 family)
MTYNSAGLEPKFPMLGSALDTSVVRPMADGSVLLAGSVRSPGGLAVVNAVQSVFGGVSDGGVTLLRPPPESCDKAVLANGASYRGPYVAPESLAVLFGCGLEGATEVQVTDVTGAVLAAQIVSVSPRQLNLVLPRDIAPGPAILNVKREGIEIATALAYVENTAPAIFTAVAGGEGAPAGVAVRVTADGSRVTVPLARCADSGCLPVAIDLGGPEDRTYLLLAGTGIRRAGEGQVTARADDVELLVAGFAAQAEGVGMDEVSIELPHALAGAGDVQVQLAIGEKLANPVTIVVK